MALTTTTLSGAVAAADGSINLTAVTSLAVGSIVQVDQEFMQVTKGWNGTALKVPVIRGQNGSAVTAHVSGANAVYGTGSDFANAASQGSVSYPISGRARVLISYSADGAIALPTPGNDAVAVLNGTSQLDMTVADPTDDMDGCVLTIIGNGGAAHTATFATAVGNGGSNLDVWTWPAGGQCALSVMAANGVWVLYPAFYAGTLTNTTITAS